AAPLGSRLPAGGVCPWLLIGPEGGFTSEELAAAQAAGASVAHLGRPALRVETAAVAAAAIALGG
ncbi:MAG: 16S rRNA (uracil(1498)-N(3))-methyltransferase, partial [Planctomycetota bacterium]|nr:16S rRNA (uracil(1498)-N(3))-methyltransferase [Planctomycetota bacterium]